MKARTVTAKRYAKALYLSAREAGSVEAVSRELEGVLAAFESHPEARAMLQRPWVKGADRGEIAMAIAERAGASPLVRRFGWLVAERGRIDHLPEIVSAYRDLVDEGLGRVRARVRGAVALTDDELGKLARQIGRAVGKEVLVEHTVDASLLGGFVAEVGSLVLDGSLDGQLARMRQRLARG
jgi:F-type H+-transporting ATPase subunit delta